MIKCHHIGKIIQQKTILKDCHFSVNKGDILGIMGESGSGKSTLARIIIGLDKPSQGHVLFHGKPYSVKKDGVRILLVFQDAFHSVNPLFTVQDILCEALPKPINQDHISHILQDVGLDETFLNKTPRQLSGGQLQRICIARALLLKPEVIIFDEALSGLDPVIQGKLLRLLYRLKQRYQLTYIFISHDPNLCKAICHRILVMFEGQIIDTLDQLDDPITVKHPITRQLLQDSPNTGYSKCYLRKALSHSLQQKTESEQYHGKTTF